MTTPRSRRLALPFQRPHVPDGVGQVLAVFGLLWVFYGLSLAGDFPSENTRAGLVVALQWLPLDVWSWLWIGAGVLSIGSAFLVTGRPGLVGFVAAWAPPFGWSCWYAAGVLFAHAPGRGLVLAGIFFAVALGILRCSTLVDASSLPRRADR